jgi:rod shape-determining protein MreC
MTNKKDALIILLMIIIVSFFGSGDVFHKYLISSNNSIKSNLVDKKDFLNSNIKLHFNTSKTIENLTEQNQLQKLQISKLKSQLIQYKKDYNETTFSSDMSSNEFIKAKTVSYVKFNNPNQLYLDINLSSNDIKALIFQDYVAGIVKDDDYDNAIAYLNGDSKCSYAVFIGKNRISAIIDSSKNNLLKAKYIPLWQEIKIGDEVISSGLDGYFKEGYKVGKVVDINSHDTYKVALIKPYIKLNNKRNFILIK